MPNTELYINTPVFPKDTEFTECGRCDGDGWIINEMYTGEHSNENEHLTCPRCEGTGELEIEQN